MEARKFNTLMPYYNHRWAAEVLGMKLNQEEGPDLIDDHKFVELKFALTNPKEHKEVKSKNYSRSWTVLGLQTDYITRQKRYWGLALYELSKPVKSIDIFDMKDLENLVLSRELFIVEWAWIHQFPAHHTNGKTKISKWDEILIYPKHNKLPEIIKTYGVKKGIVHITNGVNLENFKLGKPKSKKEKQGLAKVPF